MNILAIGCHPDDLEIGCAGTLARYVGEGHRVVMCHVANGDKGHKVIPPKELRVMRHQEAERAAGIVGAEKVFDLDVPDLEVNAKSARLLEDLIRVIRYASPDLIITHSPDDYMADHVEVSRAVFDASFSASVPHICEDAQPCEIAPIYYMDTLAGVNFLPEEYVDVSDYIDKKLSALDCHQSQIKWMLEHDKIDFLDFVRTCSKYRGMQCGVRYAEGFRRSVCWPKLTVRRLLP